jgi:UDPglucose 6-dehydrogenase
MRLTMVGTGYVGLVTGACFSNTGNKVTCLDVDAEKIAMLERGECPIYEPGLSEIIHRNTEAGRLKFTTDKDAAYRDAQVIFICVGTPPDEDGSADLSHVLTVAEDIAEAIDRLGPDQEPKLIVVKSTVPVGSSFRVRDLIRSKTDAPFHIADNPEFLKEGAAVSDFMKPDRVVCGVENDAAGQILRELYQPFVRQGNPIFIMDVLSAEMVKYGSNAMLACKISFINEIARLCELFGADVVAVREGMCSDTRIGRQFLYPGLGYGGSCFPKDTLAVIQMGRTAGYECQLNQAVHDVNQRQRDLFWHKVVDHFGGEVDGRRLAIWGIAFKPETDDIREAPSVTLMQKALATGMTVRAFDPVAGANLNRVLPQVETVDDMYDALDDADALIICTEWNEFRTPDFEEIGSRLRDRVIFDGRNLYQRSQMRRLGFNYHAVGRPPVIQSRPAAVEAGS